MQKTLILTPNKQETCGMYQLAKDLAEEFEGDIRFKDTVNNMLTAKELNRYDQVITFLYPVHKVGRWMKKNLGKKWICYNQGIPPTTKKYFPNFFRRMYMKWFAWRNELSMQGADDYWDVTEREQKPRWNKKTDELPNLFYRKGKIPDYALYVGRKTDYKNFDWLQKIMNESNIRLITPLDNCPDKDIHRYYSHAKMFATASLWEGYGRPCSEAETLKIPCVSYDTGTHKKHTKKGICVPLGDEEAFKKAVVEIWNRKDN